MSKHAVGHNSNAVAGAAPAWERLTHESAKAFAAFQAYLGLGPARDVASAYCKHRGDGQRRAVPGSWNAWSRDNQWKARALAFDEHLARLAVAEQEAATRNEAQAAIGRRAAVPELEYRAGKLAMREAIRQLKLPGSNLKGVASLIRVSSDVMRRAVGLPVTTIEDKPPSMEGVLFETPGQIAAVMPPGVMPEMPIDPTQKPDLGQSVTIGNASPLTKPMAIPLP